VLEPELKPVMCKY